MTKVEEMELFINEFGKKYTEFIALKANMAAINKMLIKRGRTDELFDTLKEVTAKFEEKNNTGDNNE